MVPTVPARDNGLGILVAGNSRTKEALAFRSFGTSTRYRGARGIDVTSPNAGPDLSRDSSWFMMKTTRGTTFNLKYVPSRAVFN